ncbi:MAG: hypothetical protein V8S32_11200 [Lachnospiraceae bacterium]
MQGNDEIVLSRVVVPGTIVVHDGVPSNANAAKYFVPYKDYIKNVASCEIYSTWPRATLTANILAIILVSLNDLYTKWFRNRGYNFRIATARPPMTRNMSMWETYSTASLRSSMKCSPLTSRAPVCVSRSFRGAVNKGSHILPELAEPEKSIKRLSDQG